MKASSPETSEKWETVCNKSAREGKDKIKNTVLAVNMAFGQDEQVEWESMLQTEVVSISLIKEGQLKGEWMYRGQLEQKHGKDEVDDMIKKGKLETRKDKWGDTEYRKRREISSQTLRTMHTGEMTRKRNIDAAQRETEDGIKQQFLNSH